MNQETLDIMRNVLILIALLSILYGIGRVPGAIGDIWSAHILAPLAPAIGGTIDRNRRCIVGTYRGRDLRVSFFPKQSVGSGVSATSINAFQIEVTNVPGKQNWQLQFQVTGRFGQGPKGLNILAADITLGERLNSVGVMDEVAAVSAPTTSYVTVAYEARRKTLTYTDDVSPRRIPSHEKYAAQLALIARLAKVNEQLNPA